MVRLRTLRQEMRSIIEATFAACILLTSFSANALAGPFEDGIAALDRRDFAIAFILLRPLAEQGSADAQITLGFLYEYGDAVPQDFVQALKWFEIAGQDTYRETIAARMTPEQIAEAQKLARAWKPK